MENDKPDTLRSHYATKEDLRGVRVEVQALRGDLQLLSVELRASMHEQGRILERSLHAQTWKIIGFVMAMNAASVTAMYYISNS